jgi:hypothetical protein
MTKLRSIATMRDTLILAQKAEESAAAPALPLAAPTAPPAAARKTAKASAAE